MDPILFFLYFDLPKINLIDLGGYGLRIQDLIAVVMVARLTFKLQPKIKLIALFIVYLALTLYMDIVFESKDALLDLFRLLEYVLVGKFCAQVIRKNPCAIDPIIIFQVFVAMFQFLQIIPNFDTGRGVIFSEKFSGSFGVSSEFTYAMILLALLRFDGFKERFLLITMFILNGTTTALLSYMAVFKSFRKIPNWLIYLFGVGGSFAFPFLFLNIDAFALASKSTKTVMDIKIFAEGTFQMGDYLSLIHRSTKAVGVIEVFLANPIYSIFGLGFGAVFSPVDFGFIRIFANFGFLGLYVFYRIFRTLRPDFFLAVAISNLLFDGVWSSTVGPLIIVVYFLYSHQSKNITQFDKRF